MLVTLDEIKGYLRVDFSDDDQLLVTILETSEKLCRDILRAETTAELMSASSSKLAVMYASAYLYEHRDEADMNKLNLSLRAMLFGDRKAGF